MASQERRRSVRISRPIDLTYSNDCPPITARIEDLSETGAFVDIKHSLPPETVVDFEFLLPFGAAPKKISGRARVVWSQPGLGVGLEFEDLSPTDRAQIRFYVASALFGHA